MGTESTVGNVARQLIKVGRELAAMGLVGGKSGNISARLSNGNVLISAKGTSLGRLELPDFVEIDLAGDPVDKSGRPSSEKLMHVEIYKVRADIDAIAHTHSPYASAYAFNLRQLKSTNYEYDLVLGGIEIARYVQPGTLEFALSARDALGKGRAALLQRHGVVATGSNPYDALAVAELVEGAAKVNYLIDTLAACSTE